ncbi:MAG: 5'-nucleotidase C-terminal domain-containing protein [Acidimicrobiia bacterium]|nr:5'-nucleotidase C-terminal domain-containing protein [Acidimicrobiia bacterium]
MGEQRTSRPTRAWLAFLMIIGLVAAALATTSPANAEHPSEGDFTLTILHNNDGESQLLNAGSGLEDFGGIARFAEVVKAAEVDAKQGNNRGSILVSSGDNFLAGPEFTAGVENGIPFYDTIALDSLNYDAISFGNHDFDFGPDVLTDFLSGYTNMPQYLASNVDFTGEPGLQAFVDSGDISASTVVNVKGERIGIIGALTQQISFISSPRNVVVNDVAPAVQAEVDSLTADGVDKIVLISHLQNIGEDIALAAVLDGVDVMVAGGGDEVLANPGDLLVPGDVPFGSYPQLAIDVDGDTVPVVTTAGNYKYLGELEVDFDADGNVIGWNGGPIRVAAGDNPDAVAKESGNLNARVVEPVSEFLAALDQTVVGTSEVALDGRRSQVRTTETNEGNLIADSLLVKGQERAASFGVDSPDVALQNGGGIRNDDFRGPGAITLLDTFDMVPFSNFLVVVPDIPRSQFKDIMENAVSRVEFTDGRFAQIAGFSMIYDAGAPAGSRVLSIVLDDGTPIVTGGAVVAGADVAIATINFLANGGDQYPFNDAPFTLMGLTYQQALADYIETDLGGVISAADYPEGGEGRITRLN